MKSEIKKNTLTLLFAVASVGACAQGHARSQRDELEDFKKKSQQEFAGYKANREKEFKDFRDKYNAEFAAFMRQRWEAFRSTAGVPVPPSPDPVKPPVVDPKTKPTSQPIPFDKVAPVAPPVAPPQPVAPIPPAPQPVKPSFALLFYNTECRFSLTPDLKIALPDLSEESVAAAWSTLSESRYNSIISDCLALRKQLKLCDWGYMLLVKELAEKFYGPTAHNEATLLQMFILTQSGYKVRIAKADSRLALLIPSDRTIYEYTYIDIGGLKHYVVDKSLKNSQFYIFNREFPKEQLISLQTGQPNLSVTETATKSYASKRYPDVSVTVSTNKNLISFYNSYPRNSGWDLYANASLSETLKKDLYPALRRSIAGKSKTEAANMLINFVQTAFDYKTDDEQFGAERALFADETFFYPASDCEDRSILYAILVKELLGLEVVLLHYPGHLATAVCFGEEVQGDYLNIENKKFVVCDPTYIGADVGRAMEKFKTVKADVIMVNG